MVVSVLAQTAPFEKGMHRSRKAAKGLQKDTTRLKRGLVGLRTAFATFAGITGVGALANQFAATARSIDQLGKVSLKLGIATEQLASLRFAAEMSGVATNTLDMALQRMTRRVSEAAIGTGEAQGALKELGLDARALASQEPHKIFIKVVEALNKVKGESDKVRLAFKLFDSEGVGLLQLIKQGPGSIRALMTEAKATGIAPDQSEVDRTTKFVDEWTRLATATRGLKEQLAISIAPSVTKMATGLKEAIEGTRIIGASPGGVGNFTMGRAAAYGKDVFAHLRNDGLRWDRKWLGIHKDIPDSRTDNLVRYDIARGVATDSRRGHIPQPRAPKKVSRWNQALFGGMKTMASQAMEGGVGLAQRSKSALDQAMAFGAQNQRQFLANMFRPRAKDEKEKQQDGNAVQTRTGNAALQRGTLAAWEAERRRDPIPKQQLQELQGIREAVQEMASTENESVSETGIGG